jgi:transcriptional regulator with XRE-family HTH domain
VPSLETLQKIASALEIPLGQFFSEEPVKEAYGFSLSQDEIRFLTQVQRYSAHLTENDRKLLLAMVRKFAATATTSIS